MLQYQQMQTAETPSRWPWAILGMVVVLVAGSVYVFRASVELPSSLVSDVTDLARAFREGTVTTTFISYATEVEGTNHLQVAKLRQVEVFERTDRASLAWGQLQLPEVVVRAEAPVETTYYLDLNAHWDFQLQEELVLVQAPRLRPNTPAIDVSALCYEVRRGSLLRDEDEAIAKLKAGLSTLSLQRATENVKLIRELSRKKTEDFIRNWLLQQYGDAVSYRIVVRFADEEEDRASDFPTPR